MRAADKDIVARQVVVNTGTQSVIPAIEGLGEIAFIHAGNWLDATSLPTHLAVIGGGAIGLEMAQFYRRMGSRVTVIEFGSQVAGPEDPDVAETLQQLLETEGIDFRRQTSVKKVWQTPAGLVLELGDGVPYRLEASHVFVATGRFASALPARMGSKARQPADFEAKALM